MASTIEPARFVVDASVAAKWHLRDEQDYLIAAALLRDFLDGHVDLIAPGHIRYEVANAIRNAWRTRRISSEEARTAIETFLTWQIPTVDDDDLILSAFDNAVRFGCSLYDGLYLALAENAGCPLIYADGRLRNAIAGRSSLALWLTDYVPLAEE